jgi:penicillin-insensitive murein DD-endopeptidase
MSQPRGGPMAGGHASHQNGLDVDVWLTPMPRRVLTAAERERAAAVDLVSKRDLAVRPDRWSRDHLAVIRLFAEQPDVERVLVNFAIKRQICQQARGNRAWLAKVRPFWGHTYHMHVRLGCAGAPGCVAQARPPAGDGCGEALDWWFREARKPPSPVPPKPRPPMTLAALPPACTAVLGAADNPAYGPVVPPDPAASADAGDGEEIE